MLRYMAGHIHSTACIRLGTGPAQPLRTLRVLTASVESTVAGPVSCMHVAQLDMGGMTSTGEEAPPSTLLACLLAQALCAVHTNVLQGVREERRDDAPDGRVHHQPQHQQLPGLRASCHDPAPPRPLTSSLRVLPVVLGAPMCQPVLLVVAAATCAALRLQEVDNSADDAEKACDRQVALHFTQLSMQRVGLPVHPEAPGPSACAQGHDVEIEEVCQRAQQEEHEPAQRVRAAAREASGHQTDQHRHGRSDRVCSQTQAPDCQRPNTQSPC